MTYSLIARDPETGELGVAVQSRSFGTGAAVPWALSGIGVVATQSFTLRSYGPRGLELMEGGAAPGEALARLLEEDDLREFRQVALLNVHGETAAHTGAACIAETGIVAGAGYSAQGNMLRSDRVVTALAQAFEESRGSLAERLLAGLEGAESEGGDFRGREAGAVLVVSGEATAASRYDRVADVRVDNHPDPLGELRRLLEHSQALRHLRRTAVENAREAMDTARAAGVDDDVARWVAAVSVSASEPELAEELVAPLAAADERWRAALATAAEAVRRSGS